MTLGGVRAYFRARLNNLGFKEWADGFNIANIPSTVLNNAYSLEVGTINIQMGGNNHWDFSYPVTLRVVTKGFKNVSQAIDAALDTAQTILADILQPSVRMKNDGIKLIRATSLNTAQGAPSNDNLVMLTITFSCSLVQVF